MSETPEHSSARTDAAESASELKPRRRRIARTAKPSTSKAPVREEGAQGAAEAKPVRKRAGRAAAAQTEEAADAAGAKGRRPRRSTKARAGEALAQDSAADASHSQDGKAVSADARPAQAQPARRPGASQSGVRPFAEQPRTGSRASGAQAGGKGMRRAGAAGGNGNSGNGNGRHSRHARSQTREASPSVTREDLAALKVTELRERAGDLGVNATGLLKADLVDAVYQATMKAEGFQEVSGILDILSDGYGFLRTRGYLPSEGDCYVGLSLIKRNGLRKGDKLTGTTRPARDSEKYAAIQKVLTVNGRPVEETQRRPRFNDLTPIYPVERLRMEHGKNTVTARVIDLVSPIGKGQRGLIVSPPKAGKTTVLKDIAAAISANNPEVHLMCLLVDERPEEVTDMERSIKGEVVASTFDKPAENHIAVSEMVIERAKRLVELGEDVVILLDSITRLARAYNLAQPASGRVLSGGVDSTALYPPKRFFGAARNIENGGSLTILATGLIETGSKMDEVIFEEFKGTGNMELRLDRALSERRIFPAIDPVASSTRKEELLIDQQVLPLIWAVRRILANMNNTERAMDMLIKSVKKTETNEEFLLRTARKAQHSARTASLDF